MPEEGGPEEDVKGEEGAQVKTETEQNEAGGKTGEERGEHEVRETQSGTGQKQKVEAEAEEKENKPSDESVWQVEAEDEHLKTDPQETKEIAVAEETGTEEAYVDEKTEQDETAEKSPEEKTELDETTEGNLVEKTESDTLRKAFEEEKANEIILVTKNSDTEPTVPTTPRGSKLSYDGPAHSQHSEAREMDIREALEEIAPSNMEPAPNEPAPEPEPAPVETKSADLSYRARAYDEKKIISAMQRAPPPHEFVGYIFSSQTPRPIDVTNFFLPIVSQPSPRKHICLKGPVVPSEVLHQTMKTAPRGLLPLSAVRISWGLSIRHTVFTQPNLYAYLTRFGPIEGIYQRGPNSILVIFCDLTSASACVKCPDLGMPWDRLVAAWWEPRMQNHGYLSRQIRQEEHNNQLAELVNDVAKGVGPENLHQTEA